MLVFFLQNAAVLPPSSSSDSTQTAGVRKSYRDQSTDNSFSVVRFSKVFQIWGEKMKFSKGDTTETSWTTALR